MKAGYLFTGNGPMVILTSHQSLTDPDLIAKLGKKGVHKFIGHEVPVELARDRYGHHFEAVVGDLHQDDDLRVLDDHGNRVFHMFRFSELGEPIHFEGAGKPPAAQ